MDLRDELNRASSIPDPQLRLAALRRLTEANPTFSLAWFNYSSALLDLDDRANAQVAIQRALVLAPTLRETLTPRMRALITQPAPIAAAEPPRSAAADRRFGLVGRSEAGMKITRIVAQSPSQVIYEARSEMDGRTCSLRLLPEVPARSLRDQTRRERAAAQVCSACARITDEIRAGDLSLQVLEALPAPPLSELLVERIIAPDEAVEICHWVSLAVADMHRAGQVHGSIRTEHVVCDPGTGRILLLGAGAGAATTGAETFALVTEDTIWAAPELLKGDPITRRTDVYGIGLLIVSLLTRRPPPALESRLAEDGQSWWVFALKTLPMEHEPVVRRLSPILWRCLAPTPSDRYAEASEIASALAAMHRPEQQTEIESASPRKNDRTPENSRPSRVRTEIVPASRLPDGGASREAAPSSPTRKQSSRTPLLQNQTLLLLAFVATAAVLLAVVLNALLS